VPLDITVTPVDLANYQVRITSSPADTQVIDLSQTSDMQTPLAQGAILQPADIAGAADLHACLHQAQTADVIVEITDLDISASQAIQTAVTMAFDSGGSYVAIDHWVKLDPQVNPDLTTGTVSITAGADIAFYQGPSGSQTQIDPAALLDLAPTAVPDNLWIEGTAASSSVNGTHINIAYAGDGSGSDDLAFTVVDIELTPLNPYPAINEFVALAVTLTPPGVDQGHVYIEGSPSAIELWDGDDPGTATQYPGSLIEWDLSTQGSIPTQYARVSELCDGTLWYAYDMIDTDSSVARTTALATVDVAMTVDHDFVRLGEFMQFDLSGFPTSHGWVQLNVAQNSDPQAGAGQILVCETADTATSLDLENMHWNANDPELPTSLYLYGQQETDEYSDIVLTLTWAPAPGESVVDGDGLPFMVVNTLPYLDPVETTVMAGESLEIPLVSQATADTGLVTVQVTSEFDPEQVRLYYLDATETPVDIDPQALTWTWALSQAPGSIYAQFLTNTGINRLDLATAWSSAADDPGITTGTQTIMRTLVPVTLALDYPPILGLGKQTGLSVSITPEETCEGILSIEIVQDANQVQLIHAPEEEDWTNRGTYAQWNLAAGEYPEDIILDANNVSLDVNDIQIIVKHVYGGTATDPNAETTESRYLTVAQVSLSSQCHYTKVGRSVALELEFQPASNIAVDLKVAQGKDKIQILQGDPNDSLTLLYDPSEPNKILTWDANNIPTDLYINGVQASGSEEDVLLIAAYEAGGHTETAILPFTVVDLRLDASSEEIVLNELMDLSLYLQPEEFFNSGIFFLDVNLGEDKVEIYPDGGPYTADDKINLPGYWDWLDPNQRIKEFDIKGVALSNAPEDVHYVLTWLGDCGYMEFVKNGSTIVPWNGRGLNIIHKGALAPMSLTSLPVEIRSLTTGVVILDPVGDVSPAWVHLWKDKLKTVEIPYDTVTDTYRWDIDVLGALPIEIYAEFVGFGDVEFEIKVADVTYSTISASMINLKGLEVWIRQEDYANILDTGYFYLFNHLTHSGLPEDQVTMKGKFEFFYRTESEGQWIPYTRISEGDPSVDQYYLELRDEFVSAEGPWEDNVSMLQSTSENDSPLWRYPRVQGEFHLVPGAEYRLVFTGLVGDQSCVLDVTIPELLALPNFREDNLLVSFRGIQGNNQKGQLNNRTFLFKKSPNNENIENGVGLKWLMNCDASGNFNESVPGRQGYVKTSGTYDGATGTWEPEVAVYARGNDMFWGHDDKYEYLFKSKFFRVQYFPQGFDNTAGGYDGSCTVSYVPDDLKYWDENESYQAGDQVLAPVYDPQYNLDEELQYRILSEKETNTIGFAE